MNPKNLLKKTVVILLSCVLSASMFAQTTPPPKQWDKRFGGSDAEYLASLQQTTDGGYILGGTSLSGIGGDKTEDNRGPYTTDDYWVVKIDANGIKQWDKRFGGSEFDNLTSLQQTTDGGYILGGSSYSGIGGDKTEDSRGAYDYWVVKIDANGIKQWDKRFGGAGYDLFYSLQQTTDGGYILGGYSEGGISGDKTEDTRGGQDYWVVKIDSNGIKQWDKRFGGTSDDILSSLQQSADGGYILGGYSYSGKNGDRTEASRGSTDYWVVKIDANGTKQWDKRFGGTSDDILSSLQQSADGGYILGGESYSGIGGDKTEDNRGQSGTPDYWVVKIDANGTKQWDKRFGGGDYDWLNSLQQTSDGGYILGGWSSSGIGGDKTEGCRGSNDYWLVKIDANGIKQWDKRFGGSSTDRLTSLQQTTDGGYILGGSSESGIGGDKTEDSRGGDDYWVVKIGCPPAANISARGNLDICKRDTVILKVNATDTLNYQWLRKGNKIPGATKGFYIATTPGLYKVIVYTDASCKNISNALKVIKSCGPVVGNSTDELRTSNFEHSTISVYPNPSKGQITVTYNSSIAGATQLNVFDVTGKKLFIKMVLAVVGNNVWQLDLAGLAAGVYNLQINNNAEQQQVRFVVEQ